MKSDEKENAPFHHKRSTPVPGNKNQLKSDESIYAKTPQKLPPVYSSTHVHDKTHLKSDGSICGADSPQKHDNERNEEKEFMFLERFQFPGGGGKVINHSIVKSNLKTIWGH